MKPRLLHFTALFSLQPLIASRSAYSMLCAFVALVVFSVLPLAGQAQSGGANTNGANYGRSVERSFGYTVGDLVVRNIDLAPDTARVIPAALPKPGYQTSWLYLREASLTNAPASVHGQRVRLTYQVTSAGSEVELIYLPVVQIKLADGATQRRDAVPITISPLTGRVAQQRAGLGDLQPDRLPAVADASQASARLWVTVPLLGLLAGLFLWRRHYLNRSERRLPFNYASRHISRLVRTGSHEATSPANENLLSAYHSLHRAFDLTAGRGVFAEDLDRFVVGYPAFTRARADIDQFYASSRNVFFGSASAATQAVTQRDALTLGQLADLARQLAGIEKNSV